MTEYDLVVANEHRQPITTSFQVATVFGKRHGNVMQAIRNLGCSDGFARANFKFVEMIEKNGIGGLINRSYYELTRDGMVLLCFGFRGKKAAELKMKYIEEFSRMREALQQWNKTQGDADLVQQAEAWVADYRARQLTTTKEEGKGN